MKLLTPANTLLTSGILITTAVVANTYSTTINIEYQTDVLSGVQTTAMLFDFVESNQSEQASFEVSGPPDSTVLVNISSSKMTLEGIEFTPLLLGEHTLILDQQGRVNYAVGGQLKSVDDTKTRSRSLTFSYDVEFTSQ